MKPLLRVTAVVFISAVASFLFLSQISPISEETQLKSANALFGTGLFARTITSPRPAKVVPYENRPAAQIAPDIESVREEIRKNPESTPTSLLLFAQTMGKRFQFATLSQTNANAFIEELNSCLDENRSVATSARAFCLRQAEQITRRFPALRSDFDLMALKASPEVRRLALNSAGRP